MLERLKSCYIIWHEYHSTLPKVHRYTIGARIDTLHVEVIEAVCAATFLSKSDKVPFVRLAIRKLDTLKVLLMLLWETKSLDTKKYIHLSQQLDETGRMLGGWYGQLQKQNSPGPGEK